MRPEVRELIKQSGFGASTVEQIAGMLPDDDLELDTWIDETIRENDLMGFHLVTFAALSRERPVDARHLSTGTRLSGGGVYLAAIALRVHGEMPEYLLEGLRNGVIHHTAQAMALLSIVFWCDERRNGMYPDQLIPQARALARGEGVLEVDAYLLEVAARTEDTTLKRLIREHYPKGPDAKWQTVVAESRKAAQITMDLARGPLSAVLPKEPVYAGTMTTTIQRAVPRIGRNEPCPCGSGKKYKHCCSGKDAKRLQQSSAVAGLTQRELIANPERHLTLQLLQQKSPAEIIRMDVSGIPRHLLTEYFVRLAVFDIDRAAANLEKLGYDDDLEECWVFTMFNAVRTRRNDIGERLMELRRPFGLKEEDLRLSERLLLARDEPGKWLRQVEDAVRNALKTENSQDLLDVAFSVAFSDASALGMLLYRGVLPFVPPGEVGKSYEEIVLPIRERLNLPVHDPLKEFLDNRGVDADIALREAEAKFEAKRREVRELRESLEEMQKELVRRENAPAPQSTAPQAANHTDPAIRQLQETIKSLKSDLNQRHNERNALQRRLERMQKRVDPLVEGSHDSPSTETHADDDTEHEDELLLPQEAETNHPFRLIEFPRNFRDRLSEFPHHVARSALAILGRLAGGDPSAFNGAKRLKGAPTVLRQRVGIDFRLLFRLLPDRIEVVDLIPRQDLERKIKTLK